MTRTFRATGAFRAARWAAPAALFLLMAMGCGLLDTSQPDIIDPGELDTPEGAQAKRIGAITEFTYAKDGGPTTDGQILTTGLLSDEFVLSTTPPTEQEVDQRAMNETNGDIFTVYFQIHRARGAAEDAAGALQRFVADPDAEAGIPEMLSLAGFTYVYFAEAFCSGVPLSKVRGDSLLYGGPVSRTAMLDTAIARFDSALAHPAIVVDANVQYLAQVGRARALLEQSQYAAAGAAVAGVPTAFEYVTEHAQSPAVLQNSIHVNSAGGLWSVSDLEGTNGLPYRTNDDPRVPWSFDPDNPVGLDGSTPQYTLLKYPDVGSAVAVANGIEARLIEAEAQLALGDTAAMLVTLNSLRALDPALSPLTGPTSITEAEDMLFSERAFWLFATGHRLGDMRRLIRQYGRTEGTVFPFGPYLKGGSYGTDVNIPVPIEEQNNPKFTASIDRNA